MRAGLVATSLSQPVAQREMRPAGVVLHPPPFDHDLRLLQ